MRTEWAGRYHVVAPDMVVDGEPIGAEEVSTLRPGDVVYEIGSGRMVSVSFGAENRLMGFKVWLGCIEGSEHLREPLPGRSSGFGGLGVLRCSDEENERALNHWMACWREGSPDDREYASVVLSNHGTYAQRREVLKSQHDWALGRKFYYEGLVEKLGSQLAILADEPSHGAIRREHS